METDNNCRYCKGSLKIKKTHKVNILMEQTCPKCNYKEEDLEKIMTNEEISFDCKCSNCGNVWYEEIRLNLNLEFID